MRKSTRKDTRKKFDGKRHWKWGDVKKYTECELQEMIDIEKKEDRQREDEIFYTKYG